MHHYTSYQLLPVSFTFLSCPFRCDVQLNSQETTLGKEVIYYNVNVWLNAKKKTEQSIIDAFARKTFWASHPGRQKPHMRKTTVIMRPICKF